MPARKPLELHSKTDRHTTRYEERRAAENAITPEARLSTRPPAELSGYPVAQKAWRFHVKLYQALKMRLATPLDTHTLLEYCLGWQYLDDLKQARKKALDAGDTKTLLSLDARIDSKGSRLDVLRSLLYLTPRSRAGVIPDAKEPENKPDIVTPGGYKWEDVAKEFSNGR